MTTGMLTPDTVRPRPLDPGPLTPDPAQGDPAGAWLRTAARRADWPAVRDFLRRVSDADDFAFYVDVAARVESSEKFYATVAAAEAHSTLPLLLYGMRAVDWAWEARTGLREEYVSRAQLHAFRERLGLAETCLRRVVAREPHNATAWYGLVVTSRGRRLGVAETGSRFQRVLAHRPGHIRAHQQMLQQLCRKWGGSPEAMHRFARAAMLGAPPGSPLGHLVAIAHLEHWLDLDDDASERYIRAPHVLARLHEAADRSVRHPAYRARPGWAVQHNAFAMAFSLAGDQRAAAWHFRAVGDVVTEFPWSYLNGPEPGTAFARRRALALRP